MFCFGNREHIIVQLGRVEHALDAWKAVKFGALFDISSADIMLSHEIRADVKKSHDNRDDNTCNLDFVLNVRKMGHNWEPIRLLVVLFFAIFHTWHEI